MLKSVTQGGQTTTFTYDADGQRVKRETVTDTIVYEGSHYEEHFKPGNKREDLDGNCVVNVADIMLVVAHWHCEDGQPCYESRYDLDSNDVINIVDVMLVADHWRETCEELAETVKYYSLGGRRVAMRREPEGQTATLYYLFRDHLGSSAVVVPAGDLDDRREIRYFAYGGRRSGNLEEEMLTDHLFTDERFDGTIELYDYGARFYDPALGRFISADPIVPEPGNPQALNRYSYVLNNPLRYVDPMGYFTVDELVDWGVTYNQIREWQQEYPAWWAIIEEARLFDEVRALRKFRGLGPEKWRGEFSIREGSLRLVDWKAWEAYDLETFRNLTKHHELWRRTGPGPTKWHPGVWEHVWTPTAFLSAYEPSQPSQGIDWGEVDVLTVLLDITAVGLAGAGVVAAALPEG